jgi:hypothetical protein
MPDFAEEISPFLEFFLDGISPGKYPTPFFLECTAVEAVYAYCERGILRALTQPSCLVWTITCSQVSSTGACERPWSVSDVVGRCWEIALGKGRRRPYHLGRCRDTGQPGETITIPTKPGEQSSLALPTGESHAPIMDMPLLHASSEPISSHCETSRVSRRILGLLASCPSLPARSRAGGPAAASACSHLRLVLAASPARHGFCSLSLAETEKPRQDDLCCGRGEATSAFLSERETHGHTPLSYTIRHPRGPLPLAVDAGIPCLEHEGVQVEAPQACSADPPWTWSREAWQIGVPVGGAHACKACVSCLLPCYGSPIRTATPQGDRILNFQQ